MRDRLDYTYLITPGHALYAAVDERLRQKLSSLIGRTACFLDPEAELPYFLHFFEMQLVGDYPRPVTLLYAELVAVRKESNSLKTLGVALLAELIVQFAMGELTPVG